MLKSKNLKSELASAALALGLLGASPSFAQEESVIVNDPGSLEETILVESEEISPEWTIDPYNPEIPEGVLWAMALLAAMFTLNAVRNKMEGAWLRAGAALAATIYLANPELVSEQYRNLPTEALILVDISDSQHLDGRDILTRQSLADLQSRLDELGINITIVEFGEAGGTPGTNLAETIQSSLNIIPVDQLSGVFVLSDGQIHDIETVMQRLNIDAPVHALISGDESEQDFRITIESAPRYSDVDEGLEIQYRVLNDHELPQGDYRADIVVRNNGEIITTLTSQNIGTAGSVLLPGLQRGNNNIEIELLRVFDNSGNSGEPEANLLGNDLSEDNNRITTTIEGIGDVVNVLMISGAPHQDTRYYREFLSSDPDINFVHFVLLRPPEREDETPLRYLATTAFPVHEVLNDNIDEYDVIIFDNYTYNGVIPLSYFDNVKQFVENGGSLFVTGSESIAAPNGLHATGLGEIFPVLPNGQVLENSFIPQVSETGERYPLSRSLQYSVPQEQWGEWHSMAGSAVQGDATVLLQDERGNPLLATREYGEGRIAVLTSDQSWVWDRLSNGSGGGPAQTLTSSLMEWLVHNESMDEENVRLIQDGEQIIVELQTLGDEAETITITSPSGQTIEVTPEDYLPGLRRAFIDADELGIYRADRSGDNPDIAFAQIGLVDPLEMRRVISTPEYVEPLAENTNGIVARMNNAPDILPYEEIAPDDTLSMGVRMSDEKELAGINRYPIPPWVPMLLIAGLFAGALKREGGKTWKETFGFKTKQKPQEPEIG